MWTPKSKSDCVPGIFKPSTSSIPAPHARTPPISPAPHPYPGLEDYLAYCAIGVDDLETRSVIHNMGIAEFDEFFSKNNSFDILKGEGIKHGPADRLTGRAAGYRDHLKMLACQNAASVQTSATGSHLFV